MKHSHTSQILVVMLAMNFPYRTGIWWETIHGGDGTGISNMLSQLFALFGGG